MDLRCTREDWLLASFPLSIQRSRNISDLPADYGQPACKMRTMSPLQATLRASADLNGVDEADVTSLASPSEEEEDGERGGSRYVAACLHCASESSFVSTGITGAKYPFFDCQVSTLVVVGHN